MTGIDGSSDDETGLHAQLVAGVKARGGDIGKVAVWAEHSYSQTGHSRDISCILAPKTFTSSMVLDVESVSPPPPMLPGDEPCGSEPAYPVPDQDTFEEWENRVIAMSPSAACTSTVRAISHALNELRLRRLTANTAGRIARRDHARHTARRLRHLLAPMWTGKEGSGSNATSGAVWVVNALGAYLPTTYRGLWEETITELRTLAPRLTSRLPPGATSQPLYPGLGLAGPDHRPVLAWVPSGNPALDARWIRRLRPLLQLRVLVDKLPHPSYPEAWTSALAASARKALNEVVSYAGQRGIVLGGTGSGTQLVMHQATLLGSSPALRGIVLIAPTLNTAEGPISLPDSKSTFSPPCMVVCGTACGARRVRLVKGAGPNLVLPSTKRMRYRLPQAAIDAAVAEEVSQWTHELALCEESTESEEEYAHLPHASLTPVTLPPLTVTPTTADVTFTPPASTVASVSRVSGRTPLTLLPPVRAPPAPAAASPAPPLAGADIMTLPVVFADDPVVTSSNTRLSSHTTRTDVAASGGGVTASIPTIMIDDGPMTVTSGSGSRTSGGGSGTSGGGSGTSGGGSRTSGGGSGTSGGGSRTSEGGSGTSSRTSGGSSKTSEGSTRTIKKTSPTGDNPMKYSRVIVAKRGSTARSPLVLRSVRMADKIQTIDID